MTPAPTDTDALLAAAAGGDADARGRLLARHRDRLARMVACRLDRLLAPRIDPSDVVQEVLAGADRKVGRYLTERPLPFYPWLRQLAWEQLATLHRRHVRAGKRSVRLEEPGVLALPDESAAELAARLVTSATSPTQAALRQELRQRVRLALGPCPPRPRGAGLAAPGGAVGGADGRGAGDQRGGGQGAAPACPGAHPRHPGRHAGGATMSEALRSAESNGHASARPRSTSAATATPSAWPTTRP